MSRFEKAQHVICHCQYHIIWTPQCRFRTLERQCRKEKCIGRFGYSRPVEDADSGVRCSNKPCSSSGKNTTEIISIRHNRSFKKGEQ